MNKLKKQQKQWNQNPTNQLNQVDLCFVVDTTGSMGGFIQAAKTQLLATMERLTAESKVNLQVGLVEYRDHPPQDTSFVTRIYPLTHDLNLMQKHINKLQAQGGGDYPEAVYDGVVEAVRKMYWRDRSLRFILLVGDAPPHGFQLPKDYTGFTHTEESRYPNSLTVQAVTAAAEKARVTVLALGMGSDRSMQQSFTALALGTGGEFASVSNVYLVIEKIASLLSKEFQNLEFDQQVLQWIRGHSTYDSGALAEVLNQSRFQVAQSISRLGKRGFFE